MTIILDWQQLEEAVDQYLQKRGMEITGESMEVLDENENELEGATCIRLDVKFTSPSQQAMAALSNNGA